MSATTPVPGKEDFDKALAAFTAGTTNWIEPIGKVEPAKVCVPVTKAEVAGAQSGDTIESLQHKVKQLEFGIAWIARVMEEHVSKLDARIATLQAAPCVPADRKRARESDEPEVD